MQRYEIIFTWQNKFTWSQKKTPRLRRFRLSHQDSNLGKQNQNLMCYHYTMGQSLDFERAKVILFRHVTKFILFHAYFQGSEKRKARGENMP